tara:strand:- start:128 stop:370 length:243 start_codon:yes stop_codon:yes gene_type:complete
MKLAIAVILVVALNGCAGLPNDYNFKSEATSGAVAVNSNLASYDSNPIIAPYTVLTPQGTMLIVPNYSTGQIQAIIQISK